MKCKHCIERLSEYYDNQLNSKEQQQIEAHLGTCTYCQEEWRKWKFILEEVHHLEEVPVPENLHERMLAGVKKEQSKELIDKNHKTFTKYWYNRSWIKVTGSVAAVFILVITLSQQGGFFRKESKTESGVEPLTVAPYEAQSMITESVGPQTRMAIPEEQNIPEAASAANHADTQANQKREGTIKQDNQAVVEQWVVTNKDQKSLLETLQTYSIEQGFTLFMEQEDVGTEGIYLTGVNDKQALKTFLEERGAEVQITVQEAGKDLKLFLQTGQ
ncbi:hypothetical protein CS063_06920 [Sporanaerobium hydrogeniformans]|uniref:Uncharacterized protein n=1 Tax=Sporanaerobium hydrogeniformans TaxID=3072179 RepID=A0AC61DDT4_9FIRM|nr:zf-HC2 domain-containing protein [Sporanaerobium hydrogeniformans]PHV71060.1 hypothetical protein CS063_06920 [Sporanaerobium hydrogeniformans]